MNSFPSFNLCLMTGRTALLATVFMSVTACTGLEKLLPRYSDNRIQKVHVITTNNVNQSTPVALDIVYIFEVALVPELQGYTARKWFDEKTQLQHLYPEKFAIFNYELVPVSQVTLIPKQHKKQFPMAHQKAAKVMVYVNYLVESNDYTLDISPFIRPTINLGERKITITDQG